MLSQSAGQVRSGRCTPGGCAARPCCPADPAATPDRAAKQDTAPEILLRKALHAAGARFRLERRLAPACTPEIVLPGRRLAVFVDGCFWHGCPEQGNSRWSGPNAALWESKLRWTPERDQRATETARHLGWTAAWIWEHEKLPTHQLLLEGSLP